MQSNAKQPAANKQQSLKPGQVRGITGKVMNLARYCSKCGEQPGTSLAGVLECDNGCKQK